MAENLKIGVTGPGRGIPWSWWAISWQLRRAGAQPQRLSVGSGELHADLAGVVVSGGNDIDPAIYGGDVSMSPHTDPARDTYELAVLTEADKRKLPVLGICRGAQLLNIHAGGTLIGDLASYRVLTSNRATLLPRKRISILPDSTLAAWMAANESRVNSLHHQAVQVTGANLRVSARDRDGIVQGIESESGPLRMGVQWHPEYLPHRHDQQRLFSAFVAACRNFREQSG